METKHDCLYKYEVSDSGKYTASCTLCDFTVTIPNPVELMGKFSSLQHTVFYLHRFMDDSLRHQFGEELFGLKMMDSWKHKD